MAEWFDFWTWLTGNLPGKDDNGCSNGNSSC